MKFSVLLDMLIELLSKRKISAGHFAEKYRLSPRTVYRYVETLAQTLPVSVKRGRGGGICLSDSYLLPSGFLKTEEYDAAIEALAESYSKTQDARFLEVKRKLSAQEKSERKSIRLSGEIDDILFDQTAFGIPDSMTEKLRLMGACIRSLRVAEIEYAEEEKRIQCKIEPHTLVVKNREICVYAFCHTKRDFHPFRLGNIYTAFQTEETFRKRPFELDGTLAPAPQKTVSVRFEITKTALPHAQAWLGAENIRMRNGRWLADATFPQETDLPRAVLAFGEGIKVISPVSLKNAVIALVEKIQNNYQ